MGLRRLFLGLRVAVTGIGVHHPADKCASTDPMVVTSVGGGYTGNFLEADDPDGKFGPAPWLRVATGKLELRVEGSATARAPPGTTRREARGTRI